MYLFIAIIFIAELVIALWIICLIQSLDCKVLATDAQITAIRPQIETISMKVKNVSAKILKTVKNICEIIQNHRQKILIAIIQDILIYLLIFLLKGKKRKYASLMHLACALKNYWACN